MPFERSGSKVFNEIFFNRGSIDCAILSFFIHPRRFRGILDKLVCWVASTDQPRVFEWLEASSTMPTAEIQAADPPRMEIN